MGSLAVAWLCVWEMGRRGGRSDRPGMVNSQSIYLRHTRKGIDAQLRNRHFSAPPIAPLRPCEPLDREVRRLQGFLFLGILKTA